MKKIFTFCLALIATLSLWADNTITYTADEKLPETTEEYSYGLHTNAFNVSITSHTFSDGIGTITFVGEVTSIGDHAFYCCSGLTSITIPNSVTSIGDYAFYCCFSLTSITIPNSVTSIGDYAFCYCSSLTSITIPNSVTSIGNNAFWYCSGLTSITIPNSVKVIGWYAFSDCSGLTSVTIGNSVTSIGNNAFCYCSSLTSITIPNSVTSIGDYAFYYCSSLTSITIPNSVASIGNNAFYGCTNLKLVVNLSNLYITKGSPNDGYVAYYADKVYNGLIIGDFVIKNDTILTEYIGQGGNVEIPNYVTNIGDRAFYGYTSLTSITIPNSVTVIGEAAFRGCFGLTSITIPNSVKVIGWYAFSDCSGLTSVTIGNSLTSILYSVFQGCTSLTSITIPNSVTSIGYSAFSDCTGLISITIGNSVTTIENEAFSNCTSLKSIVWDAKNCSNPTNPDQAPFYSIRSQITDFTLGEEVESVPNYLCSGMNNLASITIPNSVTVIGESAFRGCSGLTSIVWNAKDCSSPSGSDRAPFYEISSQITDFTLGKKVESVPNYLCSGMNKLTSITIPNSVTSIGTSAFSGCSGLTSITIPNSVTSIGWSAFSYCSGLTSITIPNSVTSIGDDAFRGCSGLTSITIPNSVTSIGDYAFSYCSGLTSITIPNSVTSIGSSTFFGCSGLTSITIPNSVTSIGEEAFSYCYYLTSITIPNSVTSIGDFAFYYCSVTSITIPNSVTNIGKSAFSGCSGLTSIVVESGNTNYDSRDNCNAIIKTSTNTLIAGCNNTVIPNSVTSIGWSAFEDCSGLTSITIPNSVTSIGDYAFSYCRNLICLTIPNSVTDIGDFAFAFCENLTSITSEAVAPPSCGSSCFYNVDHSIPVYVPAASVGAYKTAAEWKDFTNIQAMECEPEEYTRDVTPGNYGTICLPKAVAHEDIEGGVFFKIVYAVTNTNDEVTGILMEEETEGLEAGKAYIFRATADELVLPYTGAAVANPVATNGLVGNLSETPLDVPQGMYVLSNNQIRKLAGGTATAGQNRAYIDLTNVTKLNYVPAAAPNRVVLNVEGSNVATDLENIKSEDIQKVIRDGQVLILRDGKTYNVLGNTL